MPSFSLSFLSGHTALTPYYTCVCGVRCVCVCGVCVVCVCVCVDVCVCGVCARGVCVWMCG